MLNKQMCVYIWVYTHTYIWFSLTYGGFILQETHHMLETSYVGNAFDTTPEYQRFTLTIVCLAAASQHHEGVL